jgi:hypothetical protein
VSCVRSEKWVYATVGPRQPTVFGGGPDAGGGVMITHKQYWQGSRYYDRLAGDGDRIRALVQVGWYNARTGRWIYRTLMVKWVVTATLRSIGQGTTGPYSGPVQNYTC